MTARSCAWKAQAGRRRTPTEYGITHDRKVMCVKSDLSGDAVEAGEAALLMTARSCAWKRQDLAPEDLVRAALLMTARSCAWKHDRHMQIVEHLMALLMTARSCAWKLRRPVAGVGHIRHYS